MGRRRSVHLKRLGVGALMGGLLAAGPVPPPAHAHHGEVLPLMRADVNGDGAIQISDAIALLTFLFMEGPAPRGPSPPKGDVNGDGVVDISDPVFLLFALFEGRRQPAVHPVDRAFHFLDAQMDQFAAGDTPRFLESYAAPFPPGPAGTLRDVAFAYDTAVAACAFLARGTPGDRRRVKAICRAFDRVIERGNGSVPEAFRASGITTLPAAQGFGGTPTGVQAWVLLAMLQAHQAIPETEDPTFRSELLPSLQRLGEFIETRRLDDGEGPQFDGYTAGNPERPGILSTEQNIDVAAAFTLLATVTGDPVWEERARFARAFVNAMRVAGGGTRLPIGTRSDSVRVNASPNRVEDVHSWAVLAFGRTHSEVGNVGALLQVELRTDDGAAHTPRHASFKGIRFSDVAGTATSPQGVWWEGNGHMAAALQIGGPDRLRFAGQYLAEVHAVQATPPDGVSTVGGIVAAAHDHLPTGVGFEYFASPHVASTAWFLCASLGWNPLRGEPTGALVTQDLILRP